MLGEQDAAIDQLESCGLAARCSACAQLASCSSSNHQPSNGNRGLVDVLRRFAPLSTAIRRAVTVFSTGGKKPAA